MDFQEMLDRATELAEEALHDAEHVSDLSTMGLGQRASYGGLYVTPTFIACSKDLDRSLQYYGGFEYVEKKYRTELGDYVFYSVEANRVRSHICRVIDDESLEGYDDNEKEDEE